MWNTYAAVPYARSMAPVATSARPPAFRNPDVKSVLFIIRLPRPKIKHGGIVALVESAATTLAEDCARANIMLVAPN